MSDKTTCPLCQKEFSYAGLTKHIFSGGHKKEILELLVKQKVLALRYIKDYKATKTLPFITINYRTRIHLCYGCNKCYKTPSTQDKKHICPKVDEGFSIIKKMLEEPTTTSTDEPQATPLPVDNSENEALKHEVADFKKQVADLKKQLAEKPVAPASDNTENLTQALFKALDYIQNTREDFEGFAETLIKIKKFNGQDIYETCLDQFCVDEAQKNEFRKEFE